MNPIHIRKKAPLDNELICGGVVPSLGHCVPFSFFMGAISGTYMGLMCGECRAKFNEFKTKTDEGNLKV